MSRTVRRAALVVPAAFLLAASLSAPSAVACGFGDYPGQAFVVASDAEGGLYPTGGYVDVGATVRVVFSSITPAAGGYELVVTRDGVQVDRRAVTPTERGDGLLTYVTRDLTYTMADAGARFSYAIVAGGRTISETESWVATPMAEYRTYRAPVMVGDVRYTFPLGLDQDAWWAEVSTFTPAGGTAQAPVAHDLLPESTTATEPGEFASQAYLIVGDPAAYPEGNAARLAWLADPANAQPIYAQPHRVTYVERDARVRTQVDEDEPGLFARARFENLEAIGETDPSRLVAAVTRNGVFDAVCTATTLDDVAHGFPGKVLDCPVDVSYRSSDPDAESVYSAALYRMPAGMTAATPAAEIGAALRGATPLRTAAGEPLTATFQVSELDDFSQVLYDVPGDEPMPPLSIGPQFVVRANDTSHKLAPADFSLVPEGTPPSEVFVGDWDGDGVDTVAYRRGNSFFLASANSPTATFTRTDYGRPGDVIYIGDWDGDGVDTPSVRRGNEFHLKNSFSGGAADIRTAYGRVDDQVLVGDWDGDGVDTPSVRRGNEFHLKNSFSGGAADIRMDYGRADDVVLVGDWDGNGTHSPAMLRDGDLLVKNAFTGGPADHVHHVGGSGLPMTPIVGRFLPPDADWNDTGDTIAFYLPDIASRGC